MKINGHDIEAPRVEEMWRENKIYLDPNFLKDGVTNVVEFLIHNEFNKDQFGFILVKDPDGQEYAYIQTVPYYASRILPMFDQPDLKGKYTISVVHPEQDSCVTTGCLLKRTTFSEFLDSNCNDWLTISSKALCIDDNKTHISQFEHSPYLSSYLLNLVCGPLVSIEAEAEMLYNHIPMKILCRSKIILL